LVKIVRVCPQDIHLLDNGKIIDERKFADLEKRHSF
jgi:hypothetical protein|tara:strand:+ start:559 stop:666 length:108 start_codon:yes stop_codon:yes gene_type:complete